MLNEFDEVKAADQSTSLPQFERPLLDLGRRKEWRGDEEKGEMLSVDMTTGWTGGDVTESHCQCATSARHTK